MKIKQILVDFMKEQAYKPMNLKELAKIFDIQKKDLKEFEQLLSDMEKEGLILKTHKERYGVPERMNLVVGTLQGHAKGFGFVLPENKELKDIFITGQAMNGALHGDKVIARLHRVGSDTKKAEGEIIRILERANTTVIGKFERSKNFGFVVPDDERINMDIFIPKSQFNGVKDQQKVVATITQWPEKRRSPEGEITEILGFMDEPGMDVLSIIRKYNLSETFPPDVVEQAEAIPEEIPQREIDRRLDLRDQVLFTIDGADAKDLDDAVSVEVLENGNYKLGVHIADVTHYVKEKTPLDKEALERGTSVYLVDRVIPMLPRKLSNGMCSLNPHVPRLTLSIFMEIDKEGSVVDHKIHETIIESKERLVYTDVSDILEKDDQELKKKYEHLLEHFNQMETLCKILTKRRENRGSIDFDFDEAYIVLDKQGKPVEIKKAERRIANRIIEEFMLVANETIAESMYWSQVPFLYRIHEDPSEERIQEFNKFIRNFGYILKGVQEIHPKELQGLLKKIEGKKEETVITTLMLRSLQKARYSEESKGHFGLAAKYYSHFTSPIRRYPDLQIHRIIKEFINGEVTDKRKQKLLKLLPKVAESSSKRERVADEAERETDDLKKVEYMSKHIGEEFEGIISSVMPFGMFVELDNTIEGLIRISDLADDYYIYDELNYCFVGERTKKTYKIGDIVRIKVAKANVERKEIDFVLAEEQ